MNTKTLILTLATTAALAFSALAQTTNQSESPTRSGDGGAQRAVTPNEPNSSGSNGGGATSGPATDAPHLSPTNTQTGGAVDTGTPKDNADKNSYVDHQGATDSSSATK